MIKHISRIFCASLIAALCVGSLTAQESTDRTAERQGRFSAAPTTSKSDTDRSPAAKGMAKVTLTAGDVWGDGTGYQMLLDADATAYGTIIPVSGGFANSQLSEALYNEFEEKIPEKADWQLTTTEVVVNNSISIEIRAGVYDYCITNPAPGQGMYIASGDYGRYDDFAFEEGYHYTFAIAYDESAYKDYVTLTVTEENLNPCPIVKNLAAELQGTDVLLTWDVAAGTPTGYKIYNGGVLLETTQNPHCIVRNLSKGEHTLGVAAQYSDDCTPKKVTVAVKMIPSTPVENLTVVNTDDCTASLSWDEPKAADWIGYGGEVSTGIGYGTAALFTVAVRWEPEDLAELGIESGNLLTKMAIIPWVTSTAKFTLRIYQGGTSQTDAGELLYEQTLDASSLKKEVENEIILDKPFVIDASKELRIGYQVNASSGYPAGCDAGPTVAPGKSDLILWNGVWHRYADLSGWDINWIIAGYVTADGKSVRLGRGLIAPSYYDVYCNDERAGKTTDLNFEYRVEKEGTRKFCVVAVYDEQKQSEKACVVRKINCSVGINDLEETVKIYPNPVTDILNISSDRNIQGIIVYDLLGRKVLEQITGGKDIQLNMSSLKEGAYIVKIQTADNKTKSAVINKRP